jgi:F-type H+-transporting ATPase subunit epsilon
MEESFKTEIISPEKIIFSDNNNMTLIPSYEGDMSILKNHISIITFLKPGIIKVHKDKENIEEFFVKDGTVEFFNDILVVLSSSAINLKELSKDSIENLNQEAKDKLNKKDITDHDRYILNHQLDVLKEIRV